MGSLYSGAAVIVVASSWTEVENPTRNWELGRVVLLKENSDDGHDQTFRNADSGGCAAIIFGSSLIC
jgi:hypothetical protein